MRKTLLTLAVLGASYVASAQSVDFDRITHWAGSGPNRAALIVQFRTDAFVWGYRWDDSQTPDGMELIREIAQSSSHLCILTQMTGDMGYTLDGVGYSTDITTLLESLTYDFDGACADSRIAFGFFEPEISMGQTHAPGSAALEMALEAIEEAKTSHVITHPLNFTEFGYPAYDYDWWKLSNPDAGLWLSGWYDGYWSYWVGEEGPMNNLGYSGLGMSSVELRDGDVHAWKYLSFAPDADPDPEWLEPVYVDESTSVNITELSTENAEEYFTLSGVKLRKKPARGIYIMRKNGKSFKISN